MKEIPEVGKYTEYKKHRYKVVEVAQNTECEDCDLHGLPLCHLVHCFPNNRPDKRRIILKRLGAVDRKHKSKINKHEDSRI